MPTTTDEIEGEGEDKEGEDVTRPDKVKASLKSKIQDYLKDYREVFRPYLALSGGFFLIIYGGQQMGWVINLQVQMQVDPHEEYMEYIGNMWFFYGILGSLLSLVSLTSIRKRWIYLSASTLNLISAILLANSKIDLNFVFASRIVGGIAFGMVYTVLIKHAADLAHPKTRGFIVGLIHSSIVLGIFINALSFLNEDAFLVSGVCGVVFTSLGILSIFLLIVESPVDLIKRKETGEALKVIAHLRKKSEEDHEVQETFEEFQKMIEEDKAENWWNFLSKKNFFPILPAFLLKVSYVLSYNYTFNCLIMPDDFSNNQWSKTNNASIVLASVRMIGVTIGLFTIDMSRIRHFYAISITGFFALILSGLAYFATPDIYLSSAPVLAVIFLIFSGISLGVLPDVYMSEIFSNTKKPMTFFFLVTVEFGSQFLIVAVNKSVGMTIGTKAFHYGITGLMLLGIGIKLFLLAPETAKMSLRESKNMFRKSDVEFKPDVPV